MGPNRSCYCLWWREVGRPAAGGRRARAQQLVAESPRPIGVLAYDGVQPVGWAAVAPRLDFPRLNRGRDTAPVGAVEGVFVVPCFFVVESHRHQGVARELLAAAVEQARRLGALAVEGVPGDPLTEERTPSASYTGTVGLFRAAGFKEVARRSRSSNRDKWVTGVRTTGRAGGLRDDPGSCFPATSRTRPGLTVGSTGS